MKYFKHIMLSFLAISFIACENDTLEDLRNRNAGEQTVLEDLTSGEADFSTYVAVGPSFTAGFTDNGLFIAAQENSFPNILSGKFANAGGGAFTQPLMNDNFGGLIVAGNPVINPTTGLRELAERLVFGGAGPVPLQSLNPAAMSTTDFALNNPTGPFNNLGVPGAKSFHLIANGYGNITNFPAAANPYAVRITGTTPNASVLELAVAQDPTFFTADLIGGNDVLGYATSGGDANLDQITDPATFGFAFNTIISGLTANGAKGAVTNIPYVSSLPYFTTVGHDVIPLDATTAAFLNSSAAYGAYNAGLDGALAFLSAPANVGTLQFLFPAATSVESLELATAEMERRKILFSEGTNNAVVIMDEYLTNLSVISPALVSMRQATSDDLIILPASSFIGTEAVTGDPTTVNGVAIPLADNWVLTPNEQEEVTTATDAYNATISSVASSNGLALVDVNTILAQASTTGIMFDDYNLNTDLVFGGLVSLDGIHLTARGYAFMANSFLAAIDETYGSNFVASGNLAKAGDFPTNYSPTLQ